MCLVHFLLMQNDSEYLWLAPKYDMHQTNQRAGDSGAGSTLETIKDSELIATIFKIFALKMVGRSYVKVLTKKCKKYCCCMQKLKLFARG